jgi:hypothetical protein
LCICSAIEALSTFYTTAGKDRAKFLRFVNDFMDQTYRLPSSARGTTYADVLYGQFRCGLAHGFSIEGHEVATRPGPYIHDDGKGYISIDLWSLFDDMERAFDAFLAKVDTDANCRQDFIKRFDEIFVHPY